jgi:hypothetical protein
MSYWRLETDHCKVGFAGKSSECCCNLTPTSLPNSNKIRQNLGEIKRMSLIHACVAFGGAILTESSVGSRDFSQGGAPNNLPDRILKLRIAAISTILSKIPPNNSKLTCSVPFLRR